MKWCVILGGAGGGGGGGGGGEGHPDWAVWGGRDAADWGWWGECGDAAEYGWSRAVGPGGDECGGRVGDEAWGAGEAGELWGGAAYRAAAPVCTWCRRDVGEEG